MNSTAIRFVIAAGILYYALSGSGGGSIVPTSYTGPMAALHTASRSMESADRQNMADGFAAGAKMVSADSRGLISKTDIAQNFLLALLEFDYNSLRAPGRKYPEVASEVEKVFTQTLGDDIKAMTDSDRSRLADSLREMSKSLR